MEYQFRPIHTWPGPRTRSPKPGHFHASHRDTLKMLERELWFLKARNVVIQADVDSHDIRQDGMLRADARPRSPGIVLSFESKHGPLSYPCDRYSHWQENLRAITLSLQALRAVDRYGVTRHAEQYKGWARLADQRNGDFATAKEAAEFIAELIGTPSSAARILNVASEYRVAYRMAAAQLHPDRTGGDDRGFKRLQAARDVLDSHHKISV